MESVYLKGNREGVIIHLNKSMGFDNACEKMVEKIKDADDFLGSNVQIIINSGSEPLNSEQADKIKDILSSLGLAVKKFIPEVKKMDGEETVSFFDVLDKHVYIAQGPTKVIRKNLRSGQRVFYDGTIVIFGDVNPGAEVVASGHVLVIGCLRGVAHAGSKGDAQAIIFALNLQPTQLRIGSYITRAPDEEETIPSEPEIARIKNDMVVIEKYLQK